MEEIAIEAHELTSIARQYCGPPTRTIIQLTPLSMVVSYRTLGVSLFSSEASLPQLVSVVLVDVDQEWQTGICTSIPGPTENRLCKTFAG
jgi:hypothetical protein